MQTNTEQETILTNIQQPKKKKHKKKANPQNAAQQAANQQNVSKKAKKQAANQQKKIAILIDADAFPRKRLDEVYRFACQYGTPTLINAYANWGTQAYKKWHDQLKKYAVTTMPQPQYDKVGKNNADISLCVGAMDVLYKETQIYGFVIVAHDSDYVPLVTRLRQAGKVVIGVGTRTISEKQKNVYTSYTVFENNQQKGA